MYSAVCRSSMVLIMCCVALFLYLSFHVVRVAFFWFCFFFFQAEDGIRDAQESRGLGDVYKRQTRTRAGRAPRDPQRCSIRTRRFDSANPE